ncbi:transcriptional regulator ATRX-like isoform X2 [Haliotis asinina]|uniref:transcriptional regulator ATRX-like isoform X2 n=1 Tax=Haliotis asinina TaxID=109174 RepID=UPI0035326A84
MDGSSSKGSSKRKPAFTMKIKVQSKKKQESESDNDDYDSDYSKRKPVSKRDNSDYSDAESIPDLPEGTVVVKPEPVKEKKIRFSGPEFSKVPENLDIVNCTSCGRQINPNVSGAAKRHPELKVLVCRKCYSYYRSGKIEQDEDGLDEQCRWCGEGGRLLGCDHCHNAFCKSCIIRNFSRAELTTVMADDGSKWKCYVCDPSKLKKLLRECDSLFKKIEKEKLKAKTQSSIDLKKSSSSKPQKATGTKTRGKKKAETSSSDDDNEIDDEVDEDDEDDVPKMKNGKSKAPESLNGKDLENEVAKKALMAELEDADMEGGDESDNDDSESDDDTKKKKKGAKKDKKPEKDDSDNDNGNDSEDDDSDAVPNKRKRIRSKLLDAKLSDSESGSKDRMSKKNLKSEDSDSEEVVKKKSKKKKSSDEDFDSDSSLGKKKQRGRRKKKQKKRGKKRKLTSDSEPGNSSSSDSASDSDSEISLDTEEEERREKLKAERKAKRKAKGNKRRRIKEQKDSSDEKGKAETDSDVDGSDEDDDGKSPDKSGRKNIRKIKSDKKLTDDTKRARKAEEARRKRVSERQKEFNHVVQITDEQTKCPITTQLILEMDKDKKDPLIEVNKKLVRKLKPHQVEAAQFMWDCLCETTERIKKKEGSGCILAHCMGLGKTLSVITFVHTMLSNEKKTTMRTCLIVCPLNTVINWRNEWTMWFDEEDQLDVYEISSVKQNWPRADYLKDWHEGGGIMIIGYEMYRNLTQSARIKNKKLKAIFQKTLVDPGPDLVVCDEGHILKNDSSAISQALNKVRTRRRVVLTGTPLQNNLLEYHCMASFVKPNLMGTRKEFLNRFVNPITNGQHSDSTAFDVKVMGRRAHVLHEMLAGCVQRRDYSALTKFLPPKFEYVISVRLSPVQIDLYEKYLDLAGIGPDGGPPTVNRGARLFSDYQNLMKIWTHPWVLKLAEIRADNKMKYDDSEDSFIDNSTDEELASMTDNSEDSLMAVSKSDSGESEKAGPSSRSSRLSRRGKPPPEDSDKEEVVKDWKTRSRGGEDGDEKIDLDDGPKPVSNEWWAEYVKEEDQGNLDLSGKLILLFEILRMCEEIGDKVLVFSQSLLSLDIIEYFLDVIDKRAEEAATQKEEEEKLKREKDKEEKEKGEKDQNGDAKDKEDDNEEFVQTVFGKTWTKGADYFRMDGSTSPQLRSQWSEHFNDPDNFRARLFLISTKAGSLGINLVAANRVIIFDASWNPSHDIQSIFRVYRFGQTKPCYVYRFLAQGTMEEKIYERQVTKQSLSQRVVDEHQIDRHFTSADLNELYNFKPERLDDPNCPKTTHALPKDILLAELLKHNKQIVRFHEHDSLLENREDQTLTEEEKKAAWEEYDNERKGISNRVAQASTASGVGMFSPDNVLQIVQMVKMRFPNLPPDLFQAQVQAILQQQILYQQSMQNQQIEQQRMMEMHRLQRIQNDIRSQQRQINDLTRNRMVSPRFGGPMGPRMGMPFGMQHRPPNPPGALRSILTTPSGSSGKKDSSNTRSTTPNNPPVVIDLSKS